MHSTILKINNILLFATILVIPFYFVRLPIFNTTISILTIFLILSSFYIFITQSKNILKYISKEYILWIFILLFIISFTLSLFFNTTIHGMGVFIEWILLPIIFSSLMFINIYQDIKLKKRLVFFLSIILFIVNAIGLYYIITNNLTYDNRLKAIFLSPNHLAMFIVPLIFISAILINISDKILEKLFTIFTILFSLFVLYHTHSFNNILSLIIPLLFLIYIHIPKKIPFLFLAFILLCISFLFGYQKITHMNSDWHRNSISSRIMIWDSAILYTQNNPLFNSNGIDSFQEIYLSLQPYFTPYLEWAAPTPHNIFITIWISGGFLGLMFFLLLLSRWFFLVFLNTKKNTTIYLIIAAFFSILISGILDTPIWKNDLSVIFWIIFMFGIFEYIDSTKNNFTSQ